MPGRDERWKEPANRGHCRTYYIAPATLRQRGHWEVLFKRAPYLTAALHRSFSLACVTMQERLNQGIQLGGRCSNTLRDFISYPSKGRNRKETVDSVYVFESRVNTISWQIRYEIGRKERSQT